MSQERKEKLKEALRDAEISDVELENVAGGAVPTCDESCYGGCSKCCASGSANR